MAHLHALPIGHEFEGYRIERVLGAGGFGITYLATEAMIGRAVAIKEYLPSSVAARAVDSLMVHPLVAADAEVFRWGLKRFRNEARTLVSFHHPNIVPVYRFFEANGTAYLVMAYEDGASLGEILKKARTLSEDEIREFVDPLLDGVAEVHKAGFLHRDIKPANIVIRATGSPVLIDFGAARQALGAKSQSLHAIVSPGYAPFEQYSNTAPQGPFTDIYALGATLYCCVTGTRPIEATDRIAGAALRPAAEFARGRYSATLLEAIDHALGLMPEDRPQTVAAWRDELAGRRASESTLAPRAASSSPSVTAPPPATPQPSRRAFYMGLAAGAVLLAGGGGYAAVRAIQDTEEEKRLREQRAEQKRRQDAEDEARRQRDAAARQRETAARQRAEGAAERARAAQRRAIEVSQLALAARQKAITAIECARQAAIRARNKQSGHWAGQMENGAQYEGQMHNNRPQGCGILVQKNGARFEGNFVNGFIDAHGVAQLPSGLRYEGAYVQGNVTGHGVFRFAGGQELHGSHVNAVTNGPGVYIFAGGNRYEGEFRESHMVGYGTYRWTDGRVFEGEFAENARHGLGVEIAANGTKTHGRWEKNVYKGLE